MRSLDGLIDGLPGYFPEANAVSPSLRPPAMQTKLRCPIDTAADQQAA
jgi:hypothetical protein